VLLHSLLLHLYKLGFLKNTTDGLVMLILPFYDAAIPTVEWGGTLKFCVTDSHVSTYCGIVNRPAEKGNFDFGKGC
jgi:hypothetical protein